MTLRKRLIALSMAAACAATAFAGAAFTNPMNELIWKVRGDLR